MTWGCVLLTTGRKPDELAVAVGSLLAQTGVRTDVAVIVTGVVFITTARRGEVPPPAEPLPDAKLATAE